MSETFRLAAYGGNHAIGMYATVTDDLLLAPPGFDYASFFGVDQLSTHLCNTELVGVFAAANSNGVVIPSTVTDREQQRLEETGLDVGVLETEHTAIGNVILANDAGAVVGPGLSEDDVSVIESVLDVDAVRGTVADIQTVGSAGVATNDGFLLHRKADEADLSMVEDALGVDGDIGTVNFGSPFVGSGVVANTDAVLAGESTKGPETARIQKALGFVS